MEPRIGVPLFSKHFPWALWPDWKARVDRTGTGQETMVGDV